MKLALLGTDEQTMPLARAAADAGQHLAAVFQPSANDWDELRSLAPGISRVDHWQELLADGLADAIVVARGERDERLEPLRLLFQAGVAVAVSHPVVPSMLDYYELDMNRQEGGGVVLPLVPGRWHPAIEQLRQMMAADGAGTLGRIEQIVFERQLADRSKQQVLEHFARDAELAKALAGELTKVGALAMPGAESDYAALGIQMSGQSAVVVRWSVRPVEDSPGLRMTVLGAGASAVLVAPDNDELAWRLERRAAGNAEQWEFAGWDAGEAALERLAQALAGQPPEPNWPDAARDMELADAIDRSVQKGRTVDIHYEEHTEQGTFKGMMAAAGCGLLLVALVLLVMATTAANWGVPLAQFWPYVLLAALGIFLLLQSLKLVFPGETRSPHAHRAPDER